MKHHKYSKGWREWNEMTRAEAIYDLLILAGCYALAIATIAIVASLFAHS